MDAQLSGHRVSYLEDLASLLQGHAKIAAKLDLGDLEDALEEAAQQAAWLAQLPGEEVGR